MVDGGSSAAVHTPHHDAYAGRRIDEARRRVMVYDNCSNTELHYWLLARLLLWPSVRVPH
jgi:hypothetical protein